MEIRKQPRTYAMVRPEAKSKRNTTNPIPAQEKPLNVPRSRIANTSRKSDNSDCRCRFRFICKPAAGSEIAARLLLR